MPSGGGYIIIALDRLEDQPLNRSAGMVSQLRIIRCHA